MSEQDSNSSSPQDEIIVTDDEETTEPATELAEQEDEETTDKERNSKELLTREKVADLMEGDALQNVVLGIFDEISANVEKGKSAAKINSDSYAEALKAYRDEKPEEFRSWSNRDQELENALSALRQKVSEHKALLTQATEPYRQIADVDLGSVNERHRKMKVSLFNFLTAAGVSDADVQYRVPELPASVRVSTGWSPRLARVLVNGAEISYPGKNPTLTDLNRTLNIKGDAGSGARWAELFGSRDIPVGGLSVNRTISNKNFRIQIFSQ